MSDKDKRDSEAGGGTGRKKFVKGTVNPHDKRVNYSGAEGERNPFQRRKRITTGNTNNTAGNRSSSDRPKRTFENREDKPRFGNSNAGIKPGTVRSNRTSSDTSTFRKTEGTGEGRPPYKGRTDDKPFYRTDRPARSFENKDSGRPDSRIPRNDDRPSYRTDRPARSFENKDSGRPDSRTPRNDDRPSNRTDRPVRKYDDKGRGRTENREPKTENRKPTSDRPSLRNDSPFKKFEIKKNPVKKGEGRRTAFRQAHDSDDRRPKSEDRPSFKSRNTEDKPSFRTERPDRKFEGKPEYGNRTERTRPIEGRKGASSGRANTNRFSNRKLPASKVDGTGIIRLNKFLADSGVCSRREADVLISAGTVTVNGKVVTEMGMKVSVNDKVIYGGQTLNRETLRYVLLNKPKGYITTSEDPYDRKIVMELVANACTERIYPVGRLDRNTTGLLLFTNDGELAKKLMAPRHNVSKLYHVELDKPLTKSDLLRIADGIELEDGVAEVDEIAWVTEADSKKEVGIKIHSGKNRIVRRIFETFGYEVVKLDRVIFAGLTKLNLTRGKWRHLTPKEIALLQGVK